MKEIKGPAGEAEGGMLDLFLRRCVLSFGRMMFETLTKLYEQLEAFKRGEPIQAEPSSMHVDAFIQKAARTSDVTVFNKLPKSQLLDCLTTTLKQKPQPAIEALHRYFDYNAREQQP